IQQLLEQTLQAEQTSVSSRLLLLEAIAQAPLDKLPSSWLTELGKALTCAEERVARQAIDTIRTRNLQDFDAPLKQLGMDKSKPTDVRVAALSVVAPRLKEVEPAVFDFLLSRLEPNLSPLERLSAAAAVGKTPLTDAQLGRLVKAIGSAGALEMPHLV